MILKIADFGELTRHYYKYKEGLDKIEEEKIKILEIINPIKKEINSIITQSSSGLIVNNQTKEDLSIRFQELQEELLKIDNEFKLKVREMSSNLNEVCYSDLEKIITDWSIENNIDMVIGKMEVVYNKPELEITDKILDILKDKNFYVDFKN